jgi:hypothetical protein
MSLTSQMLLEIMLFLLSTYVILVYRQIVSCKFSSLFFFAFEKDPHI